MSDELGYIDHDTLRWMSVDIVTDITPRGNIISETYREYVEWREDRDLVDGEPSFASGSEFRRRIEGQIALRGYWMVCGRLDSRWSTHAIEIRTLKRVLRMLDELEREV